MESQASRLIKQIKKEYAKKEVQLKEEHAKKEVQLEEEHLKENELKDEEIKQLKKKLGHIKEDSQSQEK